MTTKISQGQIVAGRTMTLAEAVADTQIAVGDSVTISDRAHGAFDVVLASGVTPNTFNIVQCTGVGTLALVLRVKGNRYIASQWGAVADGAIDASTALNGMAAEMKAQAATTTNVSLTADFESGKYNISLPLVFEDIQRLHVLGDFELVATAAMNTVLTFENCTFMVQEGFMTASGTGSSTYSARTCQTAIIVNDCAGAVFDSVYVRNTLSDGFRGTGQSASLSIGMLQADWVGSSRAAAVPATAAVSTTISSIVQNGSANSTNQRAVLTLAAIPSELTDYIDLFGTASSQAFVGISGQVHKVIGYTGSDLEVWPWVSTADVGATVDFYFGTGLFVYGSDASCYDVKMLDAKGCGIGYGGYSLYPPTINTAILQANSIGLATGTTPTSANSGAQLAYGYFELNDFDIVQTNQTESSGSYSLVVGTTVALDMAKTQRLWSANSLGVRAATHLFAIQVNGDNNETYTSQQPYQRVGSTATVKMYRTEDYYLEGNTYTVTIEDDADYYRVFNRRNKKVYWFSDTNGMTPTGSITFVPPSGATVNGGAVDVAQVYNTASGPQEFIIHRANATTWYVEALSGATVTKV